MIITEYKEKYLNGGLYEIIEKIYHKCGICEAAIILDSDSVATHLKRPGHNITHGKYNEQFMIKANGKSKAKIFVEKKRDPAVTAFLYGLTEEEGLHEGLDEGI